MTAFYNEIDDYAATWLENLIHAGHIAPGVVDRRSIVDLEPDELRRYQQCHFFAGIGVWSYALRLAGWPDDRPVWTGSCPCQPFSTAGKGKGHEDERHLWPAWQRLVRECAPAIVFGEQVAGGDGLAWLDAVCADLEAADYAVAAANLPAAGVGAPHGRPRVYFGADAGQGRREELGASRLHDDRQSGDDIARCGSTLCVADAEGERCERFCWSAAGQGLGRADERGSSFWSASEWVEGKDGRRRPVEPGTFPLAHGATARVGRLRAYGNCIVPQAAAAFIRAADGAMN